LSSPLTSDRANRGSGAASKWEETHPHRISSVNNVFTLNNTPAINFFKQRILCIHEPDTVRGKTGERRGRQKVERNAYMSLVRKPEERKKDLGISRKIAQKTKKLTK
jgi:hypothetical protein